MKNTKRKFVKLENVDALEEIEYNRKKPILRDLILDIKVNKKKIFCRVEPGIEKNKQYFFTIIT